MAILKRLIELYHKGGISELQRGVRDWYRTSFRRNICSINLVKGGCSTRRMYTDCLRGAMSVKSPFNIVQVGANDGRHNDPIYELVKQHKNSTNIILIEPIKSVIPYLKDNYSYHPSAEIVNKAVGEHGSSSICLYGVSREYWDDIDTGYGEDWPNYRVATGVTTTDKSRMLRWIAENVQSDVNAESIIKEYDVEVVQPDSIINESGKVDDIQLLQVDTEGMDDQVVYSFFKAGIYPDMINIETRHLSEDRQEKYDKKMKNNGYDIYNYTSHEKLAIK